MYTLMYDGYMPNQITGSLFENPISLTKHSSGDERGEEKKRTKRNRMNKKKKEESTKKVK